MKGNSQSSNWIVDASLFAGFWMASMFDLTGLAVHQWLGLAVGFLAGYHLLTHWTWVKSVTQHWFGHTSAQARRFYLIDGCLLAGFSLILITGLIISTWFDINLADYAVWYTLHVMATLITLGLVMVKIGALALDYQCLVQVISSQTPACKTSAEFKNCAYKSEHGAPRFSKADGSGQHRCSSNCL